LRRQYFAICGHRSAKRYAARRLIKRTDYSPRSPNEVSSPLAPFDTAEPVFRMFARDGGICKWCSVGRPSLIAGTLLRARFVGKHGRDWFEGVLLPKCAPVTTAALLATLVFIFAFQADNITGRLSHVLLIAVPITLQV
jgi:hypothetical protein